MTDRFVLDLVPASVRMLHKVLAYVFGEVVSSAEVSAGDEVDDPVGGRGLEVAVPICEGLLEVF